MYKDDLVQVLNPRTNRWTLVDTKNGKILKHSRTKNPYKNVRIAKVSDR
jgi:hypothetical protein